MVVSWGKRERGIEGAWKKDRDGPALHKTSDPRGKGVEEGTVGSIWDMLSPRHQPSTVKHPADGRNRNECPDDDVGRMTQ